MRLRFRFVPVLIGGVAILASACTATVPGHATQTTRPAATPIVAAVKPVFAALPGAADGENQYVTGFAEAGNTIVAVGSDDGGGVTKPVLLWSRDDGASWHRARISAGSDAPSAGDTAFNVIARSGRFVALGNRSGGVSTWTSDDGMVWTRKSASRTSFTGAAHVSDTLATADGYLAVGWSVVPGRRTAPLAWTSTDGRTWVQHAAAAGLTPSTGLNLDLTGVAAAPDGTIVAVGSAESPDDEETPAVWSSRDSGRTWRRIDLPNDLGGTGTRSFFNDVHWTGRQFTAVGSGGPGAPYRGIVATSADGVHWRADTGSGALKATGDRFLSAVVRRNGAVAAFGTICSGRCEIAGVTDAGGPWTAVPLPVEPAAGDMTLLDAFVTSRDSVLLAGAADPFGDSDARIWRATGTGAFARVDVPLARSRPVVRVNDLAGSTGNVVAVGSSGKAPVVWHSRDGKSFGAATRLGPDNAFVSGVVRSASGWLAFGGETVGSNDQAVAWTSTDGVTWARSVPRQFGAAGTFSYSAIEAAVPYRGRWTVVGNDSENGSFDQSALAYSSAPGNTWTSAPGSAQGVVPNLHGGFAGARGMSAVTTLAGGLVATGYAQTRQQEPAYHPAAWVTTDAQIWRLTFLPIPAGYGSAYGESIATRGSTIVVTGTAKRDDLNTLAVWTSRDAGRTWTVAVMPGLGGVRNLVYATVVATATGFVIAGSSGSRGSAKPFLRSSTDGAGWRAGRFSDTRLAAPGDWFLAGVSVVTPGSLRYVARRVSLVGIETVTGTQRV